MNNPLGPSQPNSAWAGMGEAWSYLSYIISGVVVWGLIGYGLDSWLGTRPVLFVIGALLGNFAGIYLVYVKAFGRAKQGGDGRAS